MIVAFVGLSLLLAMTPGPDTFLVLRFSLRDAKSGIAAAAGSALGSLLWAFAVAVGLASLLEQSAAAYRIVKIAGGPHRCADRAGLLNQRAPRRCSSARRWRWA